MKKCPRCEKTLPLDNFRSRTSKGRRYPAPYCKPCTRDYQRQRHHERLAEGWTPPKRSTEDNTRTSWLRRLRVLGITEDDYLRLMEIQGGCCAICRTDEPWSRSSTWAVDHDHDTGAVRGLLCSRCNRGLGHFKDDITRLRAAIAYLEEPPYNQITAATPSST